MIRFGLLRSAVFATAVLETVLCCTASSDTATVPGDTSSPLERTRDKDWAIQTGVAFITRQHIHELPTEGPKAAEGDSAGELYSLTLSWVAHRFDLTLRDTALKPQFETYATLTLVDEAGQGLFPDYNAGVGFRWTDFPWNRWVNTSFFMGIGLSYSSHVFTIDRELHPGEDRSHLKFDWPLQFTFAIPRWPAHQLVLFNDHQSGGHIFDEGGVNSVGLGYRVEF